SFGSAIAMSNHLRHVKREPISTLTLAGRYRSGQTGRTVNPLAYAFAGSNPALPISFQNHDRLISAIVDLSVAVCAIHRVCSAILLLVRFLYGRRVVSIWQPNRERTYRFFCAIS